MSKQYGLILAGQQKKPLSAAARAAPVKPSIFDESSDSASEDDLKAPQRTSSTKPAVASGPSLMERRVARRLQEKALAEDPTIFQYDELYDDMDNKREEAKQSKSQEPRKPKYIGRLMEHAERRKLENELRVERQVQKDREAEGEMYKDKDTYVTAAYRKKLESIRQLQEQEQRDEYLEAIGDVTKQKDLDGFYRHLYEQKLGGTEKQVMKPKLAAPSTDEVAYKPIKSEATKQRSYRQRRKSEDDESAQQPQTPSSADPATEAKSHLANNIDADSDFSIDDSSEDEEVVEKPKPDTKQAKVNITQPKKEEEKKSEDVPKSPEEQQQQEQEELPTPTVSRPPPIDRTLIWRKRTVGEVFDAALLRYQERKRLRQG